MRSGGGSSGHVGMYVGEDWWMHLSTYDDHTPILDISAGSMTVASPSPTGRPARRRWSSPGIWPQGGAVRR